MPAAHWLHRDAPDALKVPAKQAAHAPDETVPVPDPYVPAAHGLHSEALLAFSKLSELAAYVPATHDRHWLAEVIPDPVSYVPPAHAAQLLSPGLLP